MSGPVKALDHGPQVRIDLAAHRMDIDPGQTGAAELSDAIREAGYTPLAIETPAGAAVTDAASGRKGCCCR
jgi:copper chaperone